MKVLHCVASLAPATGGPARSVPQLALALAGQGQHIGLWSPAPTGPLLADSPAHSGNPVRVFSGGFEAALDAFGKADLIHDHGIWLSCHHVVARAAHRRGIPRTVSPRGMLAPWALHHKKWKKWLAWHMYQRRDLQNAALLHATAGSEVLQLRKLGLEVPIAVIPNGVDFPRSSMCSTKTVSQADQKSSLRTALFLSRIQSVKGLPMLIEAWAKIRPFGWRMRVVGPDEDGHRAELERLVRSAGVTAQWSFEGPLEGAEKWAAFSNADLFILPTHSENFGIAVAEALAAGVPVITTQGAPWEGLRTHGCGWWNGISPQEIAASLQEACAMEPTSLRAMGRRGMDWMKREFGWKGIATKMITTYEEVLERAR